MDIVDAHHHLWDTNHLHYTLFDSIRAMNRPFRLTDYEEAAARNGVKEAVCVEAASAGADGLAEVRWLLDETRHSEVVLRLVAWAPIERRDLADYLEQLDALNDGRIVGVRRSFEFEPPDFPRRDETIRGVKLVGQHGFSFDLVLYHPSLPAVIDLVNACPEVQFVLDHLGKPGIRAGLFEPWRAHLAELARFDNVVCKISGVNTEADHRQWTKDQLKPYIDHAIACFGWERVLFGSDWPVCRLAGEYDQWLEALNWCVSEALETDRLKLFRDNAHRIYRFAD